MAHGFLQQKMKTKQMKDLGHDYFRDLSSRYFFQQSSSNKSRYVMHDLICDLARFVSGETFFYLNDKFKEEISVESNAAVRHSSFTTYNYDISRRFAVFFGMKSLRTFFALRTHESAGRYHLSSTVLNDLVPKLKYLRVLSLAGYSIVELPDSIGALKLLRYLNLSYTYIERLPESLSKLLNLQALMLRGCSRLVELPVWIGNLSNLQCLDISNTCSLHVMPQQISKLANLHILPKFIVGQGSGLRIRDLMRLSHLQGKLLIKGLHNVVNIEDARLANLKEKQGLDDLALEWIDNFSSPFSNPRNEEDELQVLNNLKPHQNLEKLSLRAYGGTKFPSWIGDPTFSRVVNLQLFNCCKITALPSLGKLTALRHLRIQGMDGVKEVSMEDFLSLETLHIEDMLAWEVWSWSDCPSEGVSAAKFPKLHELTLIKCPKLTGKLPVSLPSLKGFLVQQCPEAVLRVMPDLTSLASLKICDISGLVSLREELLLALELLEDLEIYDCDELKYLWRDPIDLDKLGNLKRLKIISCEQLVSLEEGEEGLMPCNLQVLVIKYCNKLERLPNGLPSLLSLIKLEIWTCPKLVCFPEGAGLPYSLRSLSIADCESLESLPVGMMNRMMNGNKNSNQQCLLEELTIEGCRSLKYFPRGRLPTTLRRLSTIKSDGCEKWFPEGILHCDPSDLSCCSRLEDLSVSLTSFPTGYQFPNSLKTLQFCYCGIQSLPILHTSFHLTQLSISCCAEIEFFPEGGLPLPNLIRFNIWKCEKLRILPSHMENLTSLEHLYIESCYSIESFPEDGFPPNLINLYICECGELTQQPMSEWGLHRLTSLKYLVIGFSSARTRGGDVDYFPDDDGLWLPLSLNYLSIYNCKNLKSISRGILHLISLETLIIRYCSNLKSLPKEGFPPTLGCLHIWHCPLLEEQCMKDKGDYWPIIAHIPQVTHID